MTKKINDLATKKLKLIDLALTELATEIKEDKSSWRIQIRSATSTFLTKYS